MLVFRDSPPFPVARCRKVATCVQIARREREKEGFSRCTWLYAGSIFPRITSLCLSSPPKQRLYNFFSRRTFFPNRALTTMAGFWHCHHHRHLLPPFRNALWPYVAAGKILFTTARGGEYESGFDGEREGGNIYIKPLSAYGLTPSACCTPRSYTYWTTIDDAAAAAVECYCWC